jgi:hypothetical protein
MVVQVERLPVLTAALVIEAAGLETFRDQFGMFQCAARGIGARRKKLGKPAEDPDTFSGNPTEKVRDEARQLLAGMCAVCEYKHCRYKEWGMPKP